MKKFVLLYLLALVLFFVLFYADTTILSRVLNDTQTSLTLMMLEPFLKPGQLQGIDIIISPLYRIIITQACNGMIPILFYFAAIVAYPSRLWIKPLWMGAGYLIFTLVNVVRILIVVYFVEQKGGRDNFYLAHDIFGNALLMMVGLGLFILFIRSSGARPEAD
ncbi:exosortase/archaeosortase family protein [Sulfurovum sp.]|jgi:exosortase/archaeosortase family protein|uniref:exosortase/archaeosortase family protein n=1 Tax=Sulfurovum sp. TaxID=1969726 RepID=UPI002A371A41|nr:exosortase/archaeosortase family protein [Sulfurovum sp.]MDD2451483.1 exosortase/archaeosortase family protein [Sulfurovum sp.]MDD3499696.1 exosortase/archaeosortase family protein [Sulfurovum sp.]MDY0403875.1 exosortase/archaeosortase family protein [Sulfurovum sp.]